MPDIHDVMDVTMDDLSPEQQVKDRNGKPERGE
jgi:hypothetical protein